MKAEDKKSRKKVENPEISPELILMKLPELLREDSKFRSQVLGVLVESLVSRAEFTIILDEIKALRVDMNKRFEDVNKRFEDINRRFEDVNKRFEDINRRFEDINRRFEDVNKRFEDINRRFEDINKRFEDINRRFEEMREDFKNELKILREDFHRAVSSVGSRWGIDAERVFRMAMGDILKKYFGADAKELFLRDEEGIVKGRADTYQVDILIKDEKHILIDVKAQANDFDVLKMHRLGKVYEKRYGVKPRLILICILAREDALSEADVLGDVEIITEPREQFKP